MTLTATIVPEETDLLCEGCGYILTGLAEGGNCPECGKAIAQSLGRRSPSAFEAAPSIGTFLQTSWAALVRPARFFAGLTTRENGKAAAWFARCNRAVAAALLAVTLCGLMIIGRRFDQWYWDDEPVVFGMMLAPVALIIYIALTLLTHVMARLLSALAVARGVRLPPSAALRMLRFHSVYLVPVAFVVAATVGGPLSLQITPLALLFYTLAVRLAVWGSGGGGRSPRIADRIFRMVRRVAFALLLVVVVGRYFDRFGSPYFDSVGEAPANWQRYLAAIVVALLMGLCYLVAMGCIAIRGTIYANDVQRFRTSSTSS